MSPSPDDMRVSRRSFLAGGVAGTACLILDVGTGAVFGEEDRTVMTVTGSTSAETLGNVLPHEHILVDFVGADRVSRDRYDRADVIETVRPHLQKLQSAGGRTLVECTPTYIGRDPVLLQKLSEKTDLNILTNTGYYGAAKDKYLPEHAFEEDANQLAERWIDEWEQGIGETNIRPGFIKIGVDSGSLSSMDRKLVRAACRTHLDTGLTIAAHTGPVTPAYDQLEVLRQEKVHPSAWIWVHARAGDDHDRQIQAARRGAWIEFDGYEPKKTNTYVRKLRRMKKAGVLQRVLLSQDNGWYHVMDPEGREFQPYHHLFTELVPSLLEDGFSREEVRMLTVRNPQEAFSIRVRSRS